MKLQQETSINTDAVKSWTTTPEGWLQIDIPVRRAGVLVYDQSQGDSFTAKEYVSEEELFATDSIKTLIGKPVTVVHHPKGGKVTSQNYRAVNSGAVVDAFRDGADLVARVQVRDEGAIQCIKRDKRLRGASAGYLCEEKPRVTGNFDGVPYDTAQKGIVYNHISIVRNPRNVNAKFNLDGKGTMNEDEIAELQDNLKTVTGERDKAVKKVGELNGELAETRKKILNLDSQSNEAYDRGLKDGKQLHAINEHAKTLGINVDSLDPKMVKLAIIKKANDKLNTDSLTDEQIDTALEMAIATQPKPAFKQRHRQMENNNDSATEKDGFAEYQKTIFGGA